MKEIKEPLLYIQQPNLVKPEPKMQESYHIIIAPEKEILVENEEEQIGENRQVQVEDRKENKESEPNYSRERSKIAESDEELLQINEEKTEEETDEHRPSWLSIKPVKPFAEMTVEEKISHLYGQFIPFPCEFVVQEASYRGILIGAEESKVTIKTFKEEVIQINRSDIRNIKLIGAK